MFKWLKSSNSSVKGGGNQNIRPNKSSTEVKGAYEALISPKAVFRATNGQVYAFSTMTDTQLARNYESIPPVATAVNRIAYAVASLPYHIVDKNTREPIPKHPVNRLLNRPNIEWQKIRSEFVRDTIIWKLLTGDAHWMMTGNASRPPLEMYVLNSLYVESKADNMGMTSELLYPMAGASVAPTTYKKDPRSGKFTPENSPKTQEIYRWSHFNATRGVSETDGKSEINSLYYEINHYILSNQHNLGLLANGARPSGVFTLKRPDGQPMMLSEEEFTRLKSELHASYTGAANAGRPMLLEGGLEWESSEFSPKDLDFSALSEAAEEKIYKVLGIPSQLVMSIKTTANNMTNLRLEFYENRVLPLGDDFCNHFNNAVLTRFDDNDTVELEVNRDAIDVLIPQRAERRKSIDESLTLTINEKRKLFNQPPVIYGDKIVDPNGRPLAGEDAKDALIVGQDATPSGRTPPKDSSTETSPEEPTDEKPIE